MNPHSIRTPLRPFARWIALLSVLVSLLSVSACRANDAPTAAPPPDPAVAISDPASPATRLLATTVTATLLVEQVAPCVDTLRQLVEKHQGTIANADVSGTDERRRAAIEARIPAKALDAFRAELRGLGEVDSETERVEDVTAPHADLEARLRNARVQEKRLLQLLEEKTGSLGDVVAIEKELASVRETIERFEAEKRVLDGRIAYATVHVSLRPVHSNLWAHPGDVIVSALVTGLRGARNLVIGALIVLAASLPSLLVIALLGGMVFLLIRALLRRRARRAAAVAS